MTNEKFQVEIDTLKKFYTLYCKDKHENQIHHSYKFNYKNQDYFLEVDLCETCLKDVSYSVERLYACPHEIKPRCRKCPNPCYGKDEWKKSAKVMKYAAIKLSLTKAKNKITSLFK